MELIDKDALLAFEQFDAQIEEHTADDILMIIKTAPTIDPIKAAGGCYCRECCFGRKPNSPDMQDGYVYCQEQSKYMSADDFCSGGEPREALGDG